MGFCIVAQFMFSLTWWGSTSTATFVWQFLRLGLKMEDVVDVQAPSYNDNVYSHCLNTT
jgi:hypothetical protein